MPAVAFKYESDDNTDDYELDLTKLPTSVLSLPSINVSPTLSLSDIHFASSPILRVSPLDSLPDLSLHDLPISTVPDSPIVPHRSPSISLISPSNSIDDDIEKYV